MNFKVILLLLFLWSLDVVFGESEGGESGDPILVKHKQEADQRPRHSNYNSNGPGVVIVRRTGFKVLRSPQPNIGRTLVNSSDIGSDDYYKNHENWQGSNPTMSTTPSNPRHLDCYSCESLGKFANAPCIHGIHEELLATHGQQAIASCVGSGDVMKCSILKGKDWIKRSCMDLDGFTRIFKSHHSLFDKNGCQIIEGMELCLCYDNLCNVAPPVRLTPIAYLISVLSFVFHKILQSS